VSEKGLKDIYVICTMNHEYYQTCGKKFIETFDKFWPREIPLYVYYEGQQPDIISDRIHYLDREKELPEYVAFRERHKGDQRAHGFRPKYNFRFDAIKFSAKAIMIAKEGILARKRFMIYLDADTETFKKVDFDWIKKILPLGQWHTDKFYDPPCYGIIDRARYYYFCACLKRKDMPTESGFYSFDLDRDFHEVPGRPHATQFFYDYIQLYTQDKIFELDEWADHFAFDHLRKKYDRIQTETTLKDSNFFDLTPAGCNQKLNVFDISVLGERMRHLKGPRKKNKSIDIK
jgi:hypothetical protein